LSAEKGGDLQHIADLGGRGAMAGLVHIGQDGTAEFVSDPAQNLQPCLHPNAAFPRERGAIGLVIAGLENEARAGGCAGLGDPFGHHARVVQAFQLARPRDQGKGRIPADGGLAHGDGAGGHWGHV